MPKILYIEDDDPLREVTASELRTAGLSVVEERRASAALKSIAEHRPDLVLLDIGMSHGDISGVDMLARLREEERWRNLPVVVLSGFGDVINDDVMTRLGVRAVLTKTDVTGAEVARQIEQILASTS
jgi:CheY-like chemotaxis protein